MFKSKRPHRRANLMVRLWLEELESRALLSGVSGAVWVGATGDPYPGARVTLLTPGISFVEEVRSDAGGTYRFDDVPNGTYRLGVAGRGYEYEEVPVTLNDSTAVEWFELDPETQPGQWSFIGDIA